MKKLIILLIIVTSCSNKIEKEDLQGNWFWYYQENYNNNLIQINIKNDSIILVDYFFLPKKGVYSLKNDTITIQLKDEILKKRISLTDTSLILNSTSFQKSDYLNNERYEELDLINLNSENKANAFELSKYEGSFILMKKNDSIKIKFENQYGNLKDYRYSIGLDSEKWGHIIFLGKGFTLKELKSIFLKLNYNNLRKIKFITKVNFQNHNYNIFFVRNSVWEKEVKQYTIENKLEKITFPNNPENYSKENYIKIKKPILIKIKSKNDFIKLDKTKNNLTYLISISIELTVEEFLLLNQKINKFRKEKNLKIKTEIIDL